MNNIGRLVQSEKKKPELEKHCWRRFTQSLIAACNVPYKFNWNQLRVKRWKFIWTMCCRRMPVRTVPSPLPPLLRMAWQSLHNIYGMVSSTIKTELNIAFQNQQYIHCIIDLCIGNSFSCIFASYDSLSNEIHRMRKEIVFLFNSKLNNKKKTPAILFHKDRVWQN